MCLGAPRKTRKRITETVPWDNCLAPVCCPPPQPAAPSFQAATHFASCLRTRRDWVSCFEMSLKLSKRSGIGSRAQAIPADAVYIEVDRTDASSTKWPEVTTEYVNKEGKLNWFRPVTLDENPAVLWRMTIGKWLAAQMGKGACMQPHN